MANSNNPAKVTTHHKYDYNSTSNLKNRFLIYSQASLLVNNKKKIFCEEFEANRNQFLNDTSKIRQIQLELGKAI